MQIKNDFFCTFVSNALKHSRWYNYTSKEKKRDRAQKKRHTRTHTHETLCRGRTLSPSLSEPQKGATLYSYNRLLSIVVIRVEEKNRKFRYISATFPLNFRSVSVFRLSIGGCINGVAGSFLNIKKKFFIKKKKITSRIVLRVIKSAVLTTWERVFFIFFFF